MYIRLGGVQNTIPKQTMGVGYLFIYMICGRNLQMRRGVWTVECGGLSRLTVTGVVEVRCRDSVVWRRRGSLV